MSARYTAHGKVILFGEHAVVYGVPALALGIERGAWAEAASTTSGVSTLSVPAWNVRVSDDPAGEGEPQLALAFRALVNVTRKTARQGALTVTAGADLPPGGGLGCSAAVGVAVARALDPTVSTDALATRVTAWESVFHGNPSGIDGAVASRGGCVYFQRNPTQPPTIVRVRVPLPMHLCIGFTGHSSSTKVLVDAVARLRERRPETTDRAFEAIHTLVKNARPAIEAGDVKAVGQLLDLNQMLLAGLFVSTPEIEHLCATARTAGALGAKLTGAGGGGCVVALVEDGSSADAVLSAWKRDGFEGFATTVGGERNVSEETSAELDVLARML
jgi:mevalonate kinase